MGLRSSLEAGKFACLYSFHCLLFAKLGPSQVLSLFGVLQRYIFGIL